MAAVEWAAETMAVVEVAVVVAVGQWQPVTSLRAKSTRPLKAARIHLSMMFFDASARFSSGANAVPVWWSCARAHCTKRRYAWYL